MPLLCAGALLGFGQALENPRVMEKLKLTLTQVTNLEEIRTRSERTAREAKLEIDILQARIKRMLYSANVDLKEVEGLMRQPMDWELNGKPPAARCKAGKSRDEELAASPLFPSSRKEKSSFGGASTR